jgi:DNA-binding MarR family transcriptional regulator
MVDQFPQGDPRAAIELMYFAYRQFTDRPDRILERKGLGRAHHRILYFVGRNPGISVSGLLEVLAVSKQALSAPLRQLSDLGLVEVGAGGGGDRRVKALRLTEAGASLESELTGAQTRLIQAAFEAAGPESRAGWTRVMRALARPPA